MTLLVDKVGKTAPICGAHNKGPCVRIQHLKKGTLWELSGTGDSQRDSRESIRTNHSQLTPLLL